MSWSPKRQRSNAPVTPDADVLLVFDGGSLGNPGKGYGSVVATGVVETPGLVRFEFDGKTTNNEAEYLTLIHGLRRVLKELARDGLDAGSVKLAVMSDSKLVVEQINGRWKVRHPGLRPLHAEAADLLRRFKSSSVTWHPRLESVRILGH